MFSFIICFKKISEFSRFFFFFKVLKLTFFVSKSRVVNLNIFQAVLAISKKILNRKIRIYRRLGN